MRMKYDMRICKCGRIHMTQNSKLEKALENNKDLLLICGGCGRAILIGADIEPDWNEPGKDCYCMYSLDFSSSKDTTISKSDFESTEFKKGIEEIIYSQGIKVPMMTGQYASDCFDGRFSDRWYPDFYKIQRKDVTVNEIMSFIDDYNRDRTTVNMIRFIQDTPKDMLEVISQYNIVGFNWKGTKYETEWNSCKVNNE